MKKQLLFVVALFLTFATQAQDTTGCALTANFSYTISGGTINFTNTSTDEPAFPFYSWSIDGLYSSMENPSFSTAGFEASELACLTVFDSTEDCSDTYCMTIYFEDDDTTGMDDSTGCDLIADFSYTISGGTINFTNTSSGEPAFPFYSWSIDGLYSSMENPNFSTAGFEASELACLTVFDSTEDCSDTYCMTIYFEDDDSTGVDDSTGCDLIADFSYTISDGTLYLTNTSTGEPADPFYTWTVNGMYAYTENPSFSTADFDYDEEVCLTVYDSLEECTDTYCMIIYFEDDSTGGTDSTGCELIASFTYSLGASTLNLTNTSTDEPVGAYYYWTVDGLTSYDENPTFSTADFESEEEVCLTVYDSLEECTDTYCMLISFDDSTGGTDSTASVLTYEELTAAIYPNPVNDNLNVQLNTMNGPVNIFIYNAVGELILTEQFNTQSGLNTIDVTALSQGLYILHITELGDTQRQLQKKFYKE